MGGLVSRPRAQQTRNCGEYYDTDCMVRDARGAPALKDCANLRQLKAGDEMVVLWKLRQSTGDKAAVNTDGMPPDPKKIILSVSPGEKRIVFTDGWRIEGYTPKFPRMIKTIPYMLCAGDYIFENPSVPDSRKIRKLVGLARKPPEFKLIY